MHETSIKMAKKKTMHT